MSAKRIITIVSVAMSMVGAAIPAQAAVGTGSAATATCDWNRRINVSPPGLNPEFPVGWSGVLSNGVVVNNLGQDVSYRAHLYRYSSAGWTLFLSGPVLRQTVFSNGGYLGGSAWLDTSTGRQVQGLTYFTGLPAGYYTVAAEYRWYPVAGTSFTGGSLPRTYVDLYDATINSYYLSTVPWCKYGY